MAITPETNLKLLKCPIRLDNKNQLTFASLQAQYNYFNSLPKLEVEEISFQRKDSVLYFEGNIDNLLSYNYCMYQNSNYDNKWFYAFITDMKYISEYTTEIHLKTDCFQTWQFDLIYRQSFVEREMIAVTDDVPGANLQPERLETGEYVNNITNYYTGLDDLCFVLQVTELMNGEKPPQTNFGGIPMAGGAYVCESISTITQIINYYANDPDDIGLTTEAIYNLYMLPKNFINNIDQYFQFGGMSEPIEIDFDVDIPTTLFGYEPRNKKLLTFPFCFLEINNNNGTSNILHYEYFSNRLKAEFKIKGVPVQGGSIKCVPKAYKNSGPKNEEEGIMSGKFPTLNWSQDNYLNWLTQNAVNNNIGIASDVISMVAGVGALATINPAGFSGIASGIQSLTNDLGQIYQHSLTPNSARGNTNGGDINVTSKQNGFHFMGKCISREYAEKIDKYFDVYGYSTNSFKVPNINNRPNWNYIKTVGININANIPQGDLQEIRKMFDDGLTLWHNTATFLDYSQNNK